jgi:hypothetical protein
VLLDRLAQQGRQTLTVDDHRLELLGGRLLGGPAGGLILLEVHGLVEE